jgi:RNA polymerase sigma-70 factor, ECF subfamily
MSALVRAFLEVAAGLDGDRAIYDSPELSSRLAALYSRGRAAHAGLEVSEAAFGRCLAGATAGSRPCPSLDELAVEDLYLACACAEGVGGAAAAFEARFAGVIRRAVSRVLRQTADRDEAAQCARQLLLVGDGTAPPKIAKYLGRGPLENWVSVAAIRVAVSQSRAESTELRLRDKAIAEAAGPSPEVLVMKGEVRRELELAVSEALAALDDRQRVVLRLYLVSGMTLAAIGRTFGVTQQTVSRWLQAGRDDVLATVGRALRERLKLPSHELASIVRLVASQLDISISRLLDAAS